VDLSHDRADLLAGLAHPEHDLGHTDAQRAMMIDVREAEIRERQIAQRVERAIDPDFASAHPLEQAAQGRLVHRLLF
jgi:hypothetical protein